MKNLFKSNFILLTLLFILILSPLSIAGEVEQSFYTDVFPETVEADLYFYETTNNIEITEDVNGNVFAFTTGDINISSNISGSLFLFADSIIIEDTAIITGNIFSYSNTLNINGMISDIYCYANDLIISDDGYIDRNLRAYATSTTINGIIGRDAFLQTNTIEFSNTGVVAGNLNYSNSTEFENIENYVLGNINYTPIILTDSTNNMISNIVKSIALSLIYALVIILLTMRVSPNFVTKSANILKEKSVLGFVIGLVTFIVFFMTSIILLVVSLGYLIGVVLALWALVILMLTIGTTVLSMGISKIITDKMQNTKKMTFVLISIGIVALINLLQFIPTIGIIISIITTVSGFGILLINLFEKKEVNTIITEIQE